MFSKPMGLRGFSTCTFFQSNQFFCFSNCSCVSTQPHHSGFFCFFGIKSDRITVIKLGFPVWMAHGTSHLSEGSLFVQRSLWIFWQLHTINNTWLFIIIFHWTINRKRLDMCIFPKIVLTAKKHPLKLTSTTFLFREVEQLAVYQL